MNNKNKELTIFTPTYNRIELLTKLYKSLLRQTNNNFTWLIIDDGSSDDTTKIVLDWVKKSLIDIKYVYQDNSGKHVAHNKAIELSKTDLFVCVDSDDILTDNAVNLILNYWHKDKVDYSFVGYCFRKGDMNANPTGKNWINDNRTISFFDLYEEYRYRGELVLVWITKALKKFKFPIFKEEKFVTENVLYYQASYTKQVKLLNDIFYLFEYKPDGYTKQGDKLYYRNPYGYAIYRYQAGVLSNSLVKKIRWIARYKGWIKAFKLNKMILQNELDKMNLPKTNAIIDLLSTIYSRHYKNKYSKKKEQYNL